MKDLAVTDKVIRVEYEAAYGALFRDLAHQAYHQGDRTEGRRQIKQALERLLQIAADHPGSKRVLEELALAYFHYWDHDRAGYPADSAAEWLERVTEASNLSSCSELDIASRLNVMEGDFELARTHAERLISRGYRAQDFMEFCLAHSLCQAP